jgi:hypothetical protein
MSSQVDKQKQQEKLQKDLDGCMTPKKTLMWLTKQREFGGPTKNVYSTRITWTNIKEINMDVDAVEELNLTYKLDLDVCSWNKE